MSDCDPNPSGTCTLCLLSAGPYTPLQALLSLSKAGSLQGPLGQQKARQGVPGQAAEAGSSAGRWQRGTRAVVVQRGDKGGGCRVAGNKGQYR